MSGRPDPASTTAGAARSVLWGVALVALCTLFYEVMLTRIFSVTLWYHFGFLAISLALLGTAAAGVFCYAFPDFLIGDRHLKNLCISAVAFGIGAPLAVTLHVTTRLPEIDSGLQFYLALAAQLTLLFATFFFAGLCITIALFRYAREVGTVYFFDLTGAALGSALVVPLLYRWSPLALAFAVAAGGFVAAWFFARAGVHGPAARPRCSARPSPWWGSGSGTMPSACCASVPSRATAMATCSATSPTRSSRSGARFPGWRSSRPRTERRSHRRPGCGSATTPARRRS
jgi:hypothetical protein